MLGCWPRDLPTDGWMDGWMDFALTHKCCAHLHFLPRLAPLDQPAVGGGRAGRPLRHLTTTHDSLETAGEVPSDRALHQWALPNILLSSNAFLDVT